MSSGLKHIDPFKIYNLGDPELADRSGKSTSTGTIQDYNKIKQEFQGKPWTDPEFPPDDTSIGQRIKDETNPDDTGKYPIVWMRVKEFLLKYLQVKLTPKFSTGPYRDTISRLDVSQGSVGDCYFLASLCALTSSQGIEFTVPKDNEDDNGSGVYHFRYWYNGCWIDIVVDDYLPFLEVEAQVSYAPFGAKFKAYESEVEFWVPLAEKAFAKLAGKYENINAGGFALDALQTLTGGFCERYRIDREPDKESLFGRMEANLNHACLVVLGCEPKHRTGLTEAKLERVQLKAGHDYTVTKVVRVTTVPDNREVELVRIRNPHGRGGLEWIGPWSDTDKGNWNKLSLADSVKTKLIQADDGEFWMEFSDVVKYFAIMDIVSFWYRSSIGVEIGLDVYDGEYSPSDTNTNREYIINVGALLPKDTDIIVLAEITAKVGIVPTCSVKMKLSMFSTSDKTKIERINGASIEENQGCRSLCSAYQVKAGTYTIVPFMNVEEKYVLRIMYHK